MKFLFFNETTDEGGGARRCGSDSGRRQVLAGMAGTAALPLIAACSPTVRIEAPAEPIEINLNIRIEQEVRVKIDRDLDELFDDEEDIF